MNWLIKATFAISLVFLFISCGGGENEIKEESLIELIPAKLDQNGKWGYVTADGKLAIDTMFVNKPGFFREGFAPVKLESGFFDFIDKTGELQGASFQNVTMFSEGLACVVEEAGPPKFINTDFETAFELPEANILGMFSDGRAAFSNQEGKWGFVNKSGDIAIEPQYDNVSHFSGNLAFVSTGTGDSRENGFIDTSGNFVIAKTDSIKYVTAFSEGMAPYSENGGWGFIGINGKEMIESRPDRTDVTDFVNGHSSYREGSAWGILDTEGNIVVLPLYESIMHYFGGLFNAKFNGRYGFIDKEGNTVIDFKYADIAVPFAAENAFVKAGANYIIINRKGERVSDALLKDVSKDYLTVLFNKNLVLNQTPEFVAHRQEMQDSLKARQERMQEEQADENGDMQLSETELLQQQNQALKEQLMMQRQQQMQGGAQVDISPEQLVAEITGATKQIINEYRDDIPALAQNLAGLQMQIQMLLQQKATDQSYMKKFESEMKKQYEPLLKANEALFRKANEYAMKQQKKMMEQQQKEANKEPEGGGE